MDTMTAPNEPRQNFYRSLDNHQIKGVGSNVWFSLVVTLTASDNKYLRYPVRGVIRSCEQGTDLRLSHAIFHELLADGSLGAPVEVRHPEFRYDGGFITA